MEWIKKGVLFRPTGEFAHSQSHAQVPFAFPTEEALRIYFSTRDANGRSRPSFLEVSYDNIQDVRYVHDQAVMDLGGPGEYDETGAMPSWFVPQPNGDIWLYYTGWSLTRESYRLSIGLAVSHDGGLTFKKMYRGSIMDRSLHNPIWAAQPSVMYDNGTYRMWYISGRRCEYIHGYPEPFYDCRHAESKDGIHWTPTGHVAIELDDFNHAVGRPSVYIEDGLYKMIYSFRNAWDYRTDRNRSYRLGYAESKDGLTWERKDDLVGIGKSDHPDDMDYEMINYAHRFTVKDKTYLIYNGNKFGTTGIGLAELVKK